ncbi:hypothetical protein [Rhodoferax ferrireducens]|uniref:hypothetical protein n=1 Tax=Rhodoferax ferrireducens TaxID=192843 RepID=UPI0002FEAB73|nr:hypothetical protein [Rhodoferax ferrireducens]
MSILDQMVAVTLRCKGIDFTQVTRDRAVSFVKSLCPGMTPDQQDVVIKNVLGNPH